MKEIKPFVVVELNADGVGANLATQLRELDEADVLDWKDRGFIGGGSFGAFLSTVLGLVWMSVLATGDGTLWNGLVGAIWNLHAMTIMGLLSAAILIVIGKDGGAFENMSLSNSGTRMFLAVAAGTIVAMLLPVWPLATLLLSVACIAYGIRPKRLEDGTGCLRARADNRVPEYRSFLLHANAWNETAEFLNRIRLKVQFKQFRDPAIAEAAAKGLEAMREEEAFMLNRVSYMAAIAREGSLGRCVSHGQARLAGPLDVAEPIARMRRQVEQLRELDEKAVASLQVETGTF